MKTNTLLLALLLALGCSGIPVNYSELQSMVDRGLGLALAQINHADTGNHLYQVTRGYIKRVVPMGHDTVDLLLMFGIKETKCLKASGVDPQTCALRSGFFVPSFSCSSRVRMAATSAQVVSVGCSHDSSSSSESSEEISSKGRRQFYTPFVNQAPAASATSPPVQPGHTFHSRPAEVRPRGDTFSNFLE